MDERLADLIAQGWSGGRGLVPRGPRWLLGFGRAEPVDVERHTGNRPVGMKVWRIEAGGRFLRSSGVVYPGGVPYPEELQHSTAVVSSEVWLYVDDDGDVLGSYAWPEAVRKPIASHPDADFDEDQLVHPSDAALEFDLKVPAYPPWDPMLAVRWSPRDVTVLLVAETLPDPLNEMVLFEQRGLSMRATKSDEPPDVARICRVHQPPFRSVRVRGAQAAGREPGRSLGPQTWPWPGELLWWADGVTYELKGFVGLQTLQDVAASLARLP